MPDEFDKEELDRLCQPIFGKLMGELSERYPDWFVVIEPNSADYFLGQDDQEVLWRARKKYPQATFFAYRLNESQATERL
jgi:hypothetical protein